MCTWTITTLVQIYFLNCIIRNALHVGPAGKIVRICQKQLLQQNSNGKVIVYLEGMALCYV